MPRGFPDWANVATTADSEQASYYTAYAVTRTVAGGTTYPIQFLNPALSGKLCCFDRIGLIVASKYVADAYGNLDLILYSITALGAGGTSRTPFKLNSLDAAAVLSCKEAAAAPGGLSASALSSVLLAGNHNRYPYGPVHHLLNAEVDLFRREPASQEEPMTLRPGEGFALADDTPAFDHIVQLFTIHREKPL